MKLRTWSKEQDRQLLQMREIENFSFTLISRLLCKPLSTVYMRYQKLVKSDTYYREREFNKQWYRDNPDYHHRTEKITAYKGFNSGKNWTNKEMQQLKKLSAQNLTDIQIYEIMGRSVGAIRTKRHKLKELEND